MGNLIDRLAVATFEGEEKGGLIRGSHFGSQILMLRAPIDYFVKFNFLDITFVHSCRSLKVVLDLEPIAIYWDRNASEWDLAPLGFSGRKHPE